MLLDAFWKRKKEVRDQTFADLFFPFLLGAIRMAIRALGAQKKVGVSKGFGATVM